MAIVGVVLAGLIALVLAAAYLPQTVAEGGTGPDAWRLRVTPGLVEPSFRLEGPQGTRVAPRSEATSLGRTAVWQTPSGVFTDTIVAGPTPREVGSVRVAYAERGEGEAGVQRVLWRRIHVAVIADEAVTVTRLVGIGSAGEVLEVVDDLPPPSSPD